LTLSAPPRERVGYSFATAAGAMLGPMEPNAAAQELPGLYRAVLDLVGELSASGDRDQANRLRAEAVKIYSRAWDERARRELLALLRRSQDDRTHRPAASHGLRQRFIRAT